MSQRQRVTERRLASPDVPEDIRRHCEAQSAYITLILEKLEVAERQLRDQHIEIKAAQP